MPEGFRAFFSKEKKRPGKLKKPKREGGSKWNGGFVKSENPKGRNNHRKKGGKAC